MVNAVQLNRELRTQLERMAQIQQQLDEVRAAVKRLFTRQLLDEPSPMAKASLPRQ